MKKIPPISIYKDNLKPQHKIIRQCCLVCQGKGKKSSGPSSSKKVEEKTQELFLKTLITFRFKLQLQAQRVQIKYSRRLVMGACCLEMLGKSKQVPSDKNSQPKQEVPDSHRSMTKIITKEDKTESVCGRGSNIEMESNSSVSNTKIFMKSKSTALFSTDGVVRHSSVLQFTLDHQSIIVKGANDNLPQNPNPEQYYTLIDKVAFVRKTMDCIRVTSPDGQSELHCPPQYLFTTLTVSEGRPVESIQEVGPNKLIQVADSPIKLKLKLRCRSCKKQLKLTCCKGIINLGMVECSGCDSKEQWSILDIQANAPIWGDGVKIDNHEQIDEAPSVLRVMGCVVCLKFSNCSKMKCGCLICNPCLSANPDFSLDMQCRMCEGSYIL